MKLLYLLRPEDVFIYVFMLCKCNICKTYAISFFILHLQSTAYGQSGRTGLATKILVLEILVKEEEVVELFKKPGQVGNNVREGLWRRAMW